MDHPLSPQLLVYSPLPIYPGFLYNSFFTIICINVVLGFAKIIFLADAMLNNISMVNVLPFSAKGDV